MASGSDYDPFGFPTDPTRRCAATTRVGQPCKMRALRTGRIQHQNGEWVDMTWAGDRCSYHNGLSGFMYGWGKTVTDEAMKRALAVGFARNQQKVAERAARATSPGGPRDAAPAG